MKQGSRSRKGPHLDWKDLARYPGIFRAGSDEERALLDRREAQLKAQAGGGINIMIAGPLAEAGIVDPEFDPPWSSPLSKAWAENEQVALYHDLEALIKIDWRLRFCRCLLDMTGRPYDREAVVVVENENGALWSYQSETTDADLARGTVVDPIDRILATSAPYSPSWYAAKILAHSRRAESLLAAAASGFSSTMHGIGLAREWMLIGETWAEANFVINHGDSALSGVAGARGGSKGGQASSALRAHKREKIIAAMKYYVDAGQSVANAARLAANKGIGGSAEANRKLWNRSRT